MTGNPPKDNAANHPAKSILAEQKGVTVEAMAQDRKMLPAAVVTEYQDSFIRAVAEAEERSLAYYTRKGVDLLIADLARKDRALFERILKTLPTEDQAEIIKLIRGEDAPA